MDTRRRPSVRRFLATLLTGVLVAAGAVAGVAVPAQAVNNAVTLTAAATVDGPGISVAVSGTGLTAEIAPQLPGQRERSAYIGLIEKGAALGAIDQGGSTPNAAVYPDDAGAFGGTLAQTADRLDRTKAYEVILWPSRSNPTEATLYQRADVAIDWTALFPPVSTETALAASAGSVVEGSAVTVTATVTPADAAGTVTLSDGGTALGTQPVASGSATFADVRLSVGSHTLTAAFAPTDPSAFASSTGTTVVDVTAAPEPEPVDPVFEPAISVFLADGVTPYAGQKVYTGDELVVKGTGFDPAANVGGRGMPIPNNLPQGSYAVFGSFADAWQPSTGATAKTRVTTDTKWALAESVLDQVPSQFQGAIRSQWAPLDADGSFTTTLTAKDFAKGLEGGHWGVYTYGAGGVANAAQELSIAIDYVGDKPVEPVFEPAISVFLADGVTPYTGQDVATGDKLVVKGTGFDPAANVGGMGVPIPSDLPQGTFVVFGKFATDWKPSAGIASSQRTMNTDSRVWALAEDVLDQVPAEHRDVIRESWTPIAADGSFTATVTLESPATPLADGNWGIYTYPGGARTPANPAQELSVPIAYVGDKTPEVPTADPKVTVSPSTDVDPAVANTLTVSGTGFTGPSAAFGAYVALGEKGTFSGSGAFPADGWVKVEWVRPGQVIDGAFTATIEVEAGALDPSKEYEVVTSAAHGLSVTDRSLDTFTAVTVKKPAPVVGPKITVTPSTDLDPAVAHTLTVSGTDFVGPGAANGAYVMFGETSVWWGDGPLPAEGWIAQAWVQSRDIAGGAFTVTLDIPAGSLDAGKSYHVATSAAHGLSQTDRSLDAFAPVTVATDAPVVPRIFLSAPSVAQGDSLDVTGTGFAPGQRATVTVHSDPITLGTATVDEAGRFSLRGSIPASFPAGQHTVRATVGTLTATAELTVTAAAVTPAPEAPAAPTCVARAVSGADITWNVKQSFRDYINGPIAKGSYSINWGSGSGAYNPTDNRGRVSFGGSAHFTGHDGLLDLTISNPRIQVHSAGSATLIANVVSKGYGGSADVNANGVAFANLSLPAATVSGSTISWNGASATLTAAGAAAFAGFYQAGAALDPVSFTFPLGANVPCDTSTSSELAATGGSSPDGTVWLGLGLLVLGAGLVALRRRGTHTTVS